MAKTAKTNVRKANVVRRKKKKRWFDIVAPKEFKGRVMGETVASEPNEVVGRALKVNLMNILDDYKRQGVNIRFKIESVNDNNAVCKTIGYEMLKSHSRRSVRKGADKMDDSFVVESKEGIKFRIRPMIITRHRVSDAVVSEIRRRAKDYITSRLNELNTPEIFESVIYAKMQKDLRYSLMKLCPIGACEIRAIDIVE
jgi:small subunit ribosomal protein S3Ae